MSSAADAPSTVAPSTVVSLAGCTEAEAVAALAKHNNDVLAAVDSLLATPAVSGNKYIPPKPKVDDGLTEEVRAKLARAREYAELLNASPRNDLRSPQTQSETRAVQPFEAPQEHP
jgi:hypothetical protein